METSTAGLQPDTTAADILIVDDTPANLEMFSDMLVNNGYSVRMARNGRSALESAQADPPDLILLDINMPGLTGFNVCEQLKANPQTSDVPVIFISAMNQTEDIVKAFTLGGVDYITKPVQYEEMMARIATHLSLHRLRRQLADANSELQHINTQLKREIKMRTRMQLQVQILSRAVQQTASSVIITDTEGQIEYVNPSFLRLTGYTQDEVMGQHTRILKSGKTPDQVYKDLWATLKDGKEWRGEFINRKKNGELFWELATISPIRNSNGRITQYMAVKDDITTRKKMEAELKRLTITDSLTETFNRRQLELLGKQELDRALRYRRSVSIIMLDIDYFKEVNDNFGHNAGDFVLQRIAKILQNRLRSTDYLGRYGGDEFIVIMPETDLDQSQVVAERLRSAVKNQKIVVNNQEIKLSISVGVSGVSSETKVPVTSFDALTQLADQALYQAKDAGRNCIRVWQGT
jgi:diguanylate cyclase (GGDEF)-like protein/PAS domain S-box-containing protein